MPPTMTMATMDSPLGPLRLYASNGALVGLYMSEHPELPAVSGHEDVLVRTMAQLAEYFAGERREFDLPLALEGTAFQQMVWRALLTIPCGETRSYGQQAALIGRPHASRAVGAANGANPISIIVPCHRVIGANGTLTGYGGGLPAKRWLLGHERSRGIGLLPDDPEPAQRAFRGM
jgi:O-6-methylguanine DNA methyltransferase